jgi:hypothetical protein
MVPQINEEQLPMVPLPEYPAGKPYRLRDMVELKLTTVMCTIWMHSNNLSKK